MLASLLAASALAAPPWVVRYVCEQTNPMPASAFRLRFSVDTRDPEVDRPLGVGLLDSSRPTGSA